MPLGVRGDTAIISAELDPTLAEAAAEIFVDDEQVDVFAADWSTVRDHGPFSLLFLDTREPKDSGEDTIIDLVEPGGIVVLDDFTPCESWPPVFAGRVDALREQWLTDERFTTAEVMVASDASVLIATSAERCHTFWSSYEPERMPSRVSGVALPTAPRPMTIQAA